MTLLLSGALTAVALTSAVTNVPDDAGTCPDLLPSSSGTWVPERAVAPADLVGLRDIGPLDPDQQDARLFTVSPDGRRAAFQLRQADADRNTYCLAIVLVDLQGGSKPIILDRGGELIRATIDFRGKAGFPTGIPIVVTPRWSPDGTWIAFLKRNGGTTQVWRAFADGRGSEALTSSGTDVEDVRIGPDGSSIIYASRPGLREAHAAIEDEGRTGYHYDDRYAPMSSNRPFPPAPIARTFTIEDLITEEVRPAAEADMKRLQARDSVAEDIWSADRADDGRTVRVRATAGATGPDSATLVVETSGERNIECGDARCRGAYRPWWTQDGRRVRFFRREGWARASTAIYEWAPGTGSPKRLYLTQDVLADCVPSPDRLLCLREGSLQPRRLEWLNLPNGRRRVLFDPNPQISGLRLGHSERLQLRNSFNLEFIADLILPVGYRRGRRYPLIVVQYDTRGFLRGGTGDEYPIQAFAGRDYAVLSIGRPASISSGIANPSEAGRVDLAGFADRRSTLSAVEVGVRMLIDRGIADPTRIGITGMSNGATTVTYALLHSQLFAAAAMSQCCFDTSLPTRVGPAAARHFYAQGYPRLTDDGEAFWREISLSRNARQVRTPILLQVSDDELMSALESFTALREVDAPIDLFVFPGEHHVKWQPAHRLAVYERSLDWFDYWLRGIRSQAAERRSELIHWDRLKASVDPARRTR